MYLDPQHCMVGTVLSLRVKRQPDKVVGLLRQRQTLDAWMECQVLLLSSGRNCQMVEVSNVSCCQIDDLSNPNGGWRNCKQKEVSNGGSVKYAFLSNFPLLKNLCKKEF